jgi:hypothetical protein
LRYLILFSTVIFFLTHAGAQHPPTGHIDSAGNSYIDISKVELEKKIQRKVSSSYADKKTKPEKEFATIKFIPGLQHSGSVPIVQIRLQPFISALAFIIRISGYTKLKKIL